MLQGEQVAQVIIAHNNGPLIELYRKRGIIIRKLWNQAARIHLLVKEHRRSPGGHIIHSNSLLYKSIKRAEVKYEKLYAKFQHISECRKNYKGAGKHVLTAYVTFGTHLGYLKALDMYPNTFIARKLQKQALKMKSANGKAHAVACVEAPPPSTIKWENMEYRDWWKVGRRRRAINFLAMISVILSILAVYFTQSFKNDISTNLMGRTNGDCEIPIHKANVTDLQDLIEDLQMGLGRVWA